MKKRQILAGIGVTAAFLSSAAGQAPFTAGNLVVLQAYEDGAGSTVSNASARLFLKEINVTTGAVVQTITVPFTAATSGNRAVTQSGSATSEGFLHRSADGKRLVFVGYNSDPGVASIATSASADVNRVIAVVDCSGAIDSTTALSDAYTGGNIRSAASANGTDLYISGNGVNNATGLAASGVRYCQLGNTTTIALQDNGGTVVAPGNTRVTMVFGGQLYFTSASGAFLGVATLGTGLPTTTGQTPMLLSGFPNSGGATAASSYDFYMADANTIYVADDRSMLSGGGVQKWTQSAGTWTLAYTLSAGLPGTSGPRCMTGKTAKGVTTLYVTSSINNANSVHSVVDTDSNATFSAALATAEANTWWRGIAFVPSGCTTGGCYANCDGSTGTPALTANDFQCFINKFAANASYANCDGSTGIPALTANDFQCFINKYAGGCS